MVQGGAGWELLAYRDVELIAEGHWRLSGFLRGLNGSTSSQASANAIVVWVNENLMQPDFFESEIGLSLHWAVNESAPQAFVFSDVAGLPWSVGHLRAKEGEAGWDVSWTRRGKDIPESWSLPEVDNAGAFQCDLYLAGDLVSTQQVTTSTLFVGYGVDEISVSQVNDSGRVGNWASIPLIAA